MTASLAPEHETAYCHNCGAAVNYHYCALCGQETRLHVPSAGEFIHEFIGHYVALEGRLWKTLYYLMRKPGFLSAEYIAGRRVRYVEPLRVYLSMSILFFAMLKLLGPSLLNFDTPPPQAAAAAEAAKIRKETLGENAAQQAVVSFSPTIAAKINGFMAKSSAEQIKAVNYGFFSYVPYAMFCLMPLFALYLKLLYLGSGRRYGEHLLFALHSNAFAFAMFGVLIAIDVLHLPFIGFWLGLWLLAYLPLAMQRVYGGTRWSTALRWAVLMTLHLASIGLAIMVALSLVVLS